MRRSTVLLAVTLVLSGLVAACTGGRGSSGFDLREDLLIQQVLQSGHCAQTDGLRICPSDSETETVSPTPTQPNGMTATATPTSGTINTPTPTMQTRLPSPTPTPTRTESSEPSIVTSLRNVTSVYCTREGVERPCNFNVEFTALRFPAGTEFRLAMRAAPVGATWILQDEPTTFAGDDPRQFLARVVVEPPAQKQAQVVVLAYLGGAANVPGQFTSLVDSHADLAFVSQVVQLIRVFDIPTPTPTPTPIPAEDGPQVSYLGIVDSARVPVPPSGDDEMGRPILVHPGAGAALVIEGRIGLDGHGLGIDAYRPDGGLPDLQVILSSSLGDGSTAVCDLGDGTQGGVPSTQPLTFDFSPALADAINDLGCRVNDGAGQQLGQIETELACTRAAGSSPFAFVEPTSIVQFCLPLARAWDFPVGDTIVVARLRDVAGGQGLPGEVVIRRPPS